MNFSILFILVVLALFWVLLIQPQRRRRQQQERLLGELAVGDEVITVGGLYGRVQAIGESDVTLEVAPQTNVRVAKSSIVGRVEPKEAESTEEPEEAPLP